MRETAAYQDVAPELERLRIKALTKAREFLMTRCAGFTLLSQNVSCLSFTASTRWGAQNAKVQKLEAIVCSLLEMQGLPGSSGSKDTSFAVYGGLHAMD